MTRPAVWAVVVAAGRSTRYGGDKLTEDLGGRRVLDWSLAAARAAADGVVLVGPFEGDADALVAGGETRSDSVRAGLAAVPDDADIVVVHDGARPLATAALFDAVVRAVRDGADAAVPGIPVVDTLKRVDPGGRVLETPDRSSLVAVQTPQAFRADALRRAHASGGEATDDAALVEAAGGRVVVVPGDPANVKLTTQLDLRVLRAALA